MSTHDGRTWGYIVASVATKTMDLGDSVLDLWTVAIMEYANDGEGDDNNSNIMSRLDMDIEAWAAVLSILIPRYWEHDWLARRMKIPTFHYCRESG